MQAPIHRSEPPSVALAAARCGRTRPVRMLLAVAWLAVLAPPAIGHAKDFAVNSVGTTNDETPGDGACRTGQLLPAPGGGSVDECTLRAAIDEANAHAGADRVVFDASVPLTPSGFVRIEAAGTLVVIDPLAIDATTAPGYDPTPEIPQPIVHLDGRLLSAGASGLRFDVGSDGSTVLGLAVVGYPGTGIVVASGAGHTLQGCHVGIDEGVRVLGNGSDGIRFENGTSDGTIGAAFDPTSGFIGAGNVVSGNAEHGIRLVSAVGHLVAGNRVGTAPSGHESQLAGVATGNGDAGIATQSGLGTAASTRIGAREALASGQEVTLGNLVSANTNAGLDLGEVREVRGNWIGLGIDGDAGDGGLGNGSGIVMNNLAGGVIADNVISGNRAGGIQFSVAVGGEADLIEGNHIGLTPDGSTTLPNGGPGIVVLAGEVRGNWIGGNAGAGIGTSAIFPPPARPLVVVGNFIGTDEAGADLGNAGVGLDLPQPRLSTSTIQVGGAGPGDGNVIGFNAAGIRVAGDVHGTRILGNFVGTDAAGLDLGNASHGIEVGPHTAVGGGAPGEGNVVGFNQGVGVVVNGGASTLGAPVSDVQVVGNWIGTDVLGRDLGNRDIGIDLRSNPLSLAASRAVQVGASLTTPEPDVAAHGNHIGFNAGGIRVAASLPPFAPTIENVMRGNVFRGNGGLRIDLHRPGVNVNDPLDADAGTNLRMNTPELGPAGAVFKPAARTLTVDYMVDTSGPFPVTVDFYGVDPTGVGDTWLGSTSLAAADAGQLVTSVLAVPSGVVVADLLTATATDADGNTSEFTQQAIGVKRPTASPTCGIGPELVAVVPLLAWARRLRRRR